MTFCPATSSSSTLYDTYPALGELTAFVEGRSQSSTSYFDFDDLEQHLRELVMSVEAEVVAAELTRLDVDRPTIVVGGVVHRRVMQSGTTYHACCGDVNVTRTATARH